MPRDHRSTELLGAYTLPGNAKDPLAATGQSVAAEAVGLGSVWLSELNGPTKDAGAVLGHVAASTQRVQLGTSITHFGTRHPMVLASWGSTMQALTGGRFHLGFGRSGPQRWRAWGLPIPTIESMEDHANILRRLWTGERFAHDGPAGTFPALGFGEAADVEPPPLLLAAIGPNTLALVGRAFDGVLLHPLLTPGAVTRSREHVRAAAERAGRDPDDVTIYAQVVTAPDTDDAQVDRLVHARAGAYLSGPGIDTAILEVNGWDPALLVEFRAALAVALEESGGAVDPSRFLDLLVGPSRVLADWTSETAAVGTSAECASTLHRFLDAGADRVIIHGTTADLLDDTVRAFTA